MVLTIFILYFSFFSISHRHSLSTPFQHFFPGHYKRPLYSCQLLYALRRSALCPNLLENSFWSLIWKQILCLIEKSWIACYTFGDFSFLLAQPLPTFKWKREKRPKLIDPKMRCTVCLSCGIEFKKRDETNGKCVQMIGNNTKMKWNSNRTKNYISDAVMVLWTL